MPQRRGLDDGVGNPEREQQVEEDSNGAGTFHIGVRRRRLEREYRGKALVPSCRLDVRKPSYLLYIKFFEM